MTIAVRAIIYHRKEQIRDIKRIAGEMEPGSTLHVITSDKHAKALVSNFKEDRLNRECCECSNNLSRDCNEEYIQIRGVNLDIGVVSNEKDLARRLRSKFDIETREDDPETSVLEIDISCAVPWEAVAVCKLSAAINIRMYTSRGDNGHIKSFPKHIDLDRSELAILKQFRGRRHFTRDEVIETLINAGLPSSGTTAQRTIKSLEDKECISELKGNEYPGERSSHGGNRVKYYRVEDNSWMMERIHERAVGKLSESVISRVPGDKEDKSYNWRNDSNP